MMQMLAIGECMIEMSGGGQGEASGWRLGFAGDTLNTLWYARAGLDPADGPVGYLTALGDDPFSDRITAFLAVNGIDTGLIRRIPGRRPGLYLIEQRGGDRTFTYWRETSAARQLADDEGALRTGMARARLIYVSGITLAILSPAMRARLIGAAAAARAAGARVAFDPNIRPALWESPEEMRAQLTLAAGASDIVLPSFDDERAAFGDADPEATARRYSAAGAGEVAVKDAGRPVTTLAGGALARHEVAPVVPVDPTGAGDAFNGAYLAWRLRGSSPAEAAAAGNAIAGEVVARHGAIIEMAGMGRWRAPE